MRGAIEEDVMSGAIKEDMMRDAIKPNPKQSRSLGRYLMRG